MSRSADPLYTQPLGSAMGRSFSPMTLPESLHTMTVCERRTEGSVIATVLSGPMHAGQLGCVYEYTAAFALAGEKEGEEEEGER